MEEANKTTNLELQHGETSTAMMFYTSDGLFWGEIIHHQEILPSRILVGITTPEFITLYNAQVLFTQPNFIGKPVSHTEIHLPTKIILGYHLLPPQEDQIDYDPTEPNRRMAPLTAYMASFRVNGSIRISGVTTVKSNIEVMKSEFISLYDLAIRHNFKTEMQPIRVNMGYFRVKNIIFAV